MNRVLIGPAPFREIEAVYAPTLRDAGLELVFPTRNAQMTEAELLDQLPGCVASLAGSEPYTRKVIAAAAEKGLKVIARGGVGYDGVDLAAATDHGVVVTYAPGTNHEAVAEHTFMLMLALTRNFVAQHNGLKQGAWLRKVVQPVRGRTLGVVGLGRIGKAVAQRAIAFRMKVIATEIEPDVAFCVTQDVPLVSFEELLQQADVVSLHVPQTELTKGMINARTLDLMKPSAYLINTSRGGVVNEPDLFAALKAKRIAGAGLDVFEDEPPGANPLFTLDNVVATAHTAGVDMKSRDDMALYAARAIVKLLGGGWPAEWVVNPAVRKG